MGRILHGVAIGMIILVCAGLLMNGLIPSVYDGSQRFVLQGFYFYWSVVFLIPLCIAWRKRTENKHMKAGTIIFLVALVLKAYMDLSGKISGTDGWGAFLMTLVVVLPLAIGAMIQMIIGLRQDL